MSTAAPGADRTKSDPGVGDAVAGATRPWVWMAALMLCAAGLAAATYLTIAHYSAAVAGILMVLYLVYTELFTLDAICLWCTAVHVITFLLFAVTLVATSQTAPDGS